MSVARIEQAEFKAGIDDAVREVSGSPREQAIGVPLDGDVFGHRPTARVFDGIGLRTGVAGQLDGFGRAPNDGKEKRERDRELSGGISGR